MTDGSKCYDQYTPPAGYRFAWSKPPISGESLIGFIARNCDLHGIDKLSTFSDAASLSPSRAESAASSHFGMAPTIARLFMTSPEEIVARTYPYVAVGNRTESFCNFFGTALRADYREGSLRRVSPASLAKSDHHRALWEIKVFSFCPESKELLISRCPECERDLAWFYTVGISYCEHCGADLRNYVQPKVKCDDMAALDFVTGLVNPDRTLKKAARDLAPRFFEKVDCGQLFEFCVALTCAITAASKKNGVISRQMKTRTDFARLTPQALADAGRAIIDWPIGFHRLAAQMRESASERQGFWGKRKELGALTYLPRDYYLAPAIKEMVKREIDRNMAAASLPLRRAEQREGNDLITTTDACRECRISSSTLRQWCEDGLIWCAHNANAAKSIRLLRREEIAAIVAARQDVITEQQAESLLGVGRSGVVNLTNGGMICQHQRPAADLFKGSAYQSSSVTRLVDNLLRMAKPIQGPPKLWVRLASAARRAPVSPTPWATIFQAILSGDLKVALRPSSRNGSVTSKLVIQRTADLIAIVQRAGSAMVAAAAPDAGIVMSARLVAEYLGTTERMVGDLAKSGALPSSGGPIRKFEHADVEAFRREFIFSNEVAHICGLRYRDVRRFLGEKGVRPSLNAHLNKDLIWNRAAVEGTLADNGAVPVNVRDRMTVGQAADFIGTSTTGVRSFISIGAIPTTGDVGWRFNRADVENFKRRYILSTEIAKRHAMPIRYVTPMLTELGIRPVFNEAANRFLIWDRETVEKALKI